MVLNDNKTFLKKKKKCYFTDIFHRAGCET